MAKKPWYADGVRFQCQGSGKCCSSRGEYGFVYLTKDDAKNMAAVLKMPLKDFKKTYTSRTDGALHLKHHPTSDDCLFLKGNRCEVYEGRPVQCRTWPFWPENMNAKAWSKEVIAFCPGVNKGPVRKWEEIKVQIEDQKKADEDIWGGIIVGS